MTTQQRRLAHEIRNGMNTLLLNMQCLPISTGDDALECVDAILTATDSIVGLVDELAALPEETPDPAH